MSIYTKSLTRLIELFNKMPGIGPKSAERLALHILKSPFLEAKALAEEIMAVKNGTVHCQRCNNFSEDSLCEVCSDYSREHSIVCVVEEPKDVIALEKSGEYKGSYYVLMGVLSPLDGIGPQDIRIKGLINRIKQGEVKEVIIATNPNTEGDTTALYLTELIKPLNINVSRIAKGIPVGGHLEFADSATLSEAMHGRKLL